MGAVILYFSMSVHDLVGSQFSSSLIFAYTFSPRDTIFLHPLHYADLGDIRQNIFLFNH